MENAKIALKIDNLYKSYGHKQVLSNLSLEVKEGELFGFLGCNGIGKSTTIDCVIGAKKFEKGSISICDIDIQMKPIEAKKLIGYVPSEPVLYYEMTGFQYLSFISSIYGVTKDHFEMNLKELCEKLRFDPSDLSRLIGQYSFGMKQKISLIASLIHSPKIWILDEPTASLDFFSVEELRNLMKDYITKGNTVFLTSHNIEFVSSVCSRIAIINKGEVKAEINLSSETTSEDVKNKFIEVYR